MRSRWGETPQTPRHRRSSFVAAGLIVASLAAAGCQKGSATGTGASGTGGHGTGGTGRVDPPWLSDARILVTLGSATNDDCRTGICRHSENVDLINWNNAIWLVHR